MTGLGLDTVGLNTQLLYYTRQIRGKIQKARQEKTTGANPRFFEGRQNSDAKLRS